MTSVTTTRRPRAPLVVVACLTLGLTVLGLAAIRYLPSRPVAPEALPLGLTLVVISALYLLSDIVRLQFRAGYNRSAVQISDLPLVLGILLLPPELLLTACLAGTLSIRSFRYAPPLRTAFNLSVHIAEIGVASAILHAVPRSQEQILSAECWWLPYLAVLAANALSLVAVLTSSRVLHGRLGRRYLWTMVVAVVASGAFGATLAVLSLQVLQRGAYGVVLLFVAWCVMGAIYRSYATMLRRHADLEQVMTATATLAAAGPSGDLTQTMLAQARRLVHADRAMLLRGEESELDELLGEGGSLLISRHTRVAAERDWLRRHHHDDALAIRVDSTEGRIGVLVLTDRLGNRSFSSDDLSRIQLLVRHAEALWANSLLTQRLQFDATHDSLTGLVNRSHLLFVLGRRLEATVSHSYAEEPGQCDAALLLVDLNRFKEVNETLGHPAGDTLLSVVAERLRTVVPKGSQLARLAGDEFGVLLGASTVAEVMSLAERMRSAIAEPVQVGRARLEAGCAIGVTLVPQDANDATTALRRADVALEAAKRSKRTTRYQPGMDTATVDRLESLSDLRRAVEDGGVQPWFQPKVDLQTGAIVGFEALARWEHPTRGTVLPDEFIPMAESGGLAAALTTTMLTLALHECRRWNRDGAGVGVAVNVPSRLLEDSEFPRTITRVLAEAKVAPELLTLEITEGSAVSGSKEAVRSLQDLRETGVRISVDDFGTGYSALGYLHRLPVDEVKIDKSFVRSMHQNPQTGIIVSAIIDLASRMQLVTVAEGVEEAEVCAELVSLGCRVGQGYWISRPLPAHQVAPWLRDHPVTVDLRQTKDLPAPLRLTSSELPASDVRMGP